MRRLAIIGLLLALAGTGAVALAQTPSLRAHRAACESGPAPADRFAVFTGSMPSGEGVAAMAMRFDLYEREPGSRFRRVALPNWGVWERTSKRDVPGFIFTKRVEQLDAPAAFRAVVRFRWFDANGKLLRRARRTSKTCVQPDQRPDLQVRRVTLPRQGKARTAKVVVRNRGRGAAGPFDVEARRTGATAPAPAHARVDGLLAGEQTTVRLRLGRCPAGETVTVTVDGAGEVDEAREDDDVVTVTCPKRR